MQRNKILKVLVSVAAAFLLWLYVITVISPGSKETYYDIPVKFQNENVLAERDLIITAYDDSVTLELEGNRTDLNSLNESNINILANVSGIMAPGVHKVNYDISYPGKIADNAVTATKKSTDMLTVYVDTLVRNKEVEISYEPIGTLGEGYYPETPVYSQNGEPITKVLVSGPAAMVSKIEKAVVYVDFEGRTESVAGDLEYTLCDAEGQRVVTDPKLVTTNMQAVRMDMKICRSAELPLTVKLVAGGGATADNCTVTITPVTGIVVSGEDKILKDLKALEIGTVDLSQLLEDTTLTLPLTMPEGVVNRTEGVNEVQAQIQLKGLKTRKIQVTQFRVDNKAAGLSHDGLPQSVTVEVRGPAELVDKLKSEDVTVVLDMKNAAAGLIPVQAKIQFSDAFKALGALSKHEILVNLKAQ